MSLLSVEVGVKIRTFIPEIMIQIVSIIIFFILGLKFIILGCKIPRRDAELQNLEDTHRELNIGRNEENVDLIQSNQQQGQNNNAYQNGIQNLEKLDAKLKIFCQTFFIIFISEIGGNTQITSIYLTFNYKPLIVFISSIIVLLFFIITAVIIGKLISNKISEKITSIFTGILFLLLGIITIYLVFFFDYFKDNNSFRYPIHNIGKIPDKKDIFPIEFSKF